jgi:dTDP-4-dehydrorhamnose 3,5-epimerase
MIDYTFNTSLEGVLIIKNKVYGDNRGCFLENYHKDAFESVINCGSTFIQDNTSLSKGKNVIRGLHYQLQYPQAKLVSVLGGSILDVIVDIRKDSPTFKQYISIVLKAFDGQAIYIPKGYAHGFRTLTDGYNIVCYKITAEYHPNDAYSINWNDSDINIDWLFNNKDEQNLIEISEKDKNAPYLKDIDSKYLPSLNTL